MIIITRIYRSLSSNLITATKKTMNRIKKLNIATMLNTWTSYFTKVDMQLILSMIEQIFTVILS